MTTIDFYTHCADRFEVASKLVAKAWAQHGTVRVLTDGAQATEEFGRFLWLWPATGFMPHCQLQSPLATETPILRGISAAAIEAIRAAIPKGRFATVDDIAPAYVFLASEDARHIVGQCISPNGGDVML